MKKSLKNIIYLSHLVNSEEYESLEEHKSIVLSFFESFKNLYPKETLFELLKEYYRDEYEKKSFLSIPDIKDFSKIVSKICVGEKITKKDIKILIRYILRNDNKKFVEYLIN